MKKIFIALCFLLISFYGDAQEKQFYMSAGGGYAFYSNIKKGTACEFELVYSYNKYISVGLFLSQNYAFNIALHDVPYRSDYYTLYDVSENAWKTGVKINAFPLNIKRHRLGFNFGIVYNRINHTNSNEIFEVIHDRYNYVVAAASGFTTELNALIGTEYYYKFDNFYLGLGYYFQHFDKMKKYGKEKDYHQLLVKIQVPLNKKKND